MRHRAHSAAGVALLAVLCATAAQAGSIRFFGNGVNQIDRIKIRIDDPATSSEPARPADVGQDFTIEFWVKGSTANNNGSHRCGNTYGWIDGNTIFDRDRHSQQRAFGISLNSQGRVAFGATSTTGVWTICGTRNVLDGNWHHVAVTRRTTGDMRLFVDGAQDASTTSGPTGDISYPDNGVPENRCNGPCTESDPFIVLGAEKHDAGTSIAPSFNGFMDELRISSTVRYSGSFTPSNAPFVTDANTGGLYHFDEATSGNCTSGTVITDSATGQSPGACFFGGSPGGPQWSSDTPFTSSGPGTVQLQSGTFAGTEGSTPVNIAVTRTGGTDGSASVSYQTANGTAQAGTDYTAQSGVLSWANGDGAAKSFSIPLVDDSINEAPETLTVTLSAPGGAALGAPTTAVVTINDDDNPGTLQLSASAYAASEEGAPFTVTARRIGGSDGVVSVNYATADGTALSGSDYTAASGTLTWNDGDAVNRTFTVAITNDTEVDSGETFAVALSSPSGGAVLGAPASATVTISDTDTAGSLQFSAPGLTVAEGSGTAVLQVTRTGGNAGAVSVRCATTAGTAQAPGDYTTTTVTLNWPSGDMTAKTCSIPIIDDVLNETTESFQAALSQFMGATAGTQTTSTVTIQDDDPAGTLQFSVATASIVEANGPLVLQVTRVGGSGSAASVRCTANSGTAIAGADFTNPNVVLSWAAGDAAPQTCSIPITDDVLDEPGAAETFQASLTQATGSTIGAPSSVAVGIQDDDPTTGALQFQTNGFSAAEGDGTVVITVTRVGGSESAVSVQYMTTPTGSTATAGVDYVETSGTLTWSDGDMTSRQFTVTINQDAIVESNETVRLQLFNFVGAQQGNPINTALTIVNDDLAPSGVLQLSSAAYDVNENAGTATITVRRVGGANGTASVNFQTGNGTATAPGDYVSRSGTLNWADGDSADRTFAVTIVDDTSLEGAETLNVQLSNAVGAPIGGVGSATVTIADNDVAQPGTLQFAQPTLAVNEDAGTLNLAITRTAGSDGAAQVTVTTSNGTAIGGNDFGFQNTSVSWAAGETGTRTVAVQVTNDSDQEPDESFTATLINPSGGAALGVPASMTVTINANDVPTGSSNNGGGGGALDWWTLLVGLLPILRGRHIRAYRPS